MTTSKKWEFLVHRGKCLGQTVYRGFAPLKDLAAISKADIFDQKKNPTGTQRNLSRPHAKHAYEYVSSKPSAFYPEIILNIRDKSAFTFTPRPGFTDIGILSFGKDPTKPKPLVVSRLDGNHRLWFTDGHETGYDPVDIPVSFCFLNLTKLEKELELFRDINDNQMGMNTSHLHNITARLLGEKSLKVTDPSLYITKKLHTDSKSPFFGQIHQGGIIKRGATLSGLTTANLRNAVQDMLSRSAKLSQFPDTDAQYQLIRNFWAAVREWIPKAWDDPGAYIIFKGVGLYAISYLGIEIIDRCVVKGKFKKKDMLAYLHKLPNNDVFRKGNTLPYAGRAGGRKMAAELIADLEEEGEISMTKLQKMIMGT